MNFVQPRIQPEAFSMLFSYVKSTKKNIAFLLVYYSLDGYSNKKVMEKFEEKIIDVINSLIHHSTLIVNLIVANRQQEKTEPVELWFDEKTCPLILAWLEF
jgi:hypothetical protein